MEIDRCAQELASQQRKKYETVEFFEWKEKRLARDERKHEERSVRCRLKRYGSATESDLEGSDEGFEYHVEEVNTSDEDFDVVEERKRMKRYYKRHLYRQYELEKANPRIFARTMR